MRSATVSLPYFLNRRSRRSTPTMSDEICARISPSVLSGTRIWLAMMPKISWSSTPRLTSLTIGNRRPSR